MFSELSLIFPFYYPLIFTNISFFILIRSIKVAAAQLKHWEKKKIERIIKKLLLFRIAIFPAEALQIGARTRYIYFIHKLNTYIHIYISLICKISSKRYLLSVFRPWRELLEQWHWLGNIFAVGGNCFAVDCLEGFGEAKSHLYFEEHSSRWWVNLEKWVTLDGESY